MSGGTGNRRRWGVVRVEVPVSLADELAGLMGGGALGAEVVEDGSGRATLSVYVETEDEAHAAAARARHVLDAFPVSGESPGTAVVETVAEDRWVERYQESLRPLPLGDRFVVLPPGAEIPNESGRTAIRMVPGRAFGTGEHPTTRLCAAELENRVSPGSLWIDVGTGSGILALVAAHCGARRVLAVDIDGDAVEVARDWIARNGMSAIVDARTSDRATLGEEAADGVVVNVSAVYLETDADALARPLRTGGVLVASGFLVEDLDLISGSLCGAGFHEETRSETDGWACVVMRLHAEGSTWGG